MLNRLHALAEKSGVTSDEMLNALITRAELELEVKPTPLTYKGNRGRPKGWKLTPEQKQKMSLCMKVHHLKRKLKS